MNTKTMTDVTGKVLITGVTGYVGGRLLRRFTDQGIPVRGLARHPGHVRIRAPHVEIVQGDLLDPESLQPAMMGIDTAYYLVHAMSAGADFEKIDRESATHFAQAAKASGIRRIIYLGGLAHGAPETLSTHMRSRHEVGDILRSSGVPVIEFRASIVIGSGSLSFELIRALIERLPMMVTPRWVGIKAQPIAISDLLDYLEAGRTHPAEESVLYEIGGQEQMAYGGLMRTYAQLRGLRRRMLPVPVLTPRLSSLWLGLVTPVYARVGRALINSIGHASVVEDSSARTAFPDIEPMGVSEAISSAMRNEDQDFAETRWSDALSSGGREMHWGGIRFGARIVDSRTVRVDCSPEAAFYPVQTIGGRNGWYYANFLWKVRGWVDLASGGVGMRRGRRHPEELHVGDTLDWWRIEAIEPGKRLLLRAEMKVPGRAWLEFESDTDGDGTIIRQTALFDHLGLSGLAYWYALYPIHVLIFSGMLREIARRAQDPATESK